MFRMEHQEQPSPLIILGTTFLLALGMLLGWRKRNTFKEGVLFAVPDVPIGTSGTTRFSPITLEVSKKREIITIGLIYSLIMRIVCINSNNGENYDKELYI